MDERVAWRWWGMKKHCRWHRDCYGWMCGMEMTRGEEVLRVARQPVWMKWCTEIAMSDLATGGYHRQWHSHGHGSVLELTRVVTSRLATPYPLLPLHCKHAWGRRCEHSSCPSWAEHQPVVPLYIKPPGCFLPWAVGNASSGSSLHVSLEALAKCCDSCVIAQHTNRGERGCFPTWLRKYAESKVVFAKTVARGGWNSTQTSFCF